MTETESAELLTRWRGGDQGAATELVRRFTERLLVLVRRRVSEKLSRRMDAEDVVQSAYRSFFAGAREDRYVLERSGDLWALLVGITLHKLHHKVAYHTAAKRSVNAEQAASESGLLELHAERLSDQPSPEEAAAVVDELEWVMRDLNPLHRQMVEMRLQGSALEEIAAATERSERLVRRVIGKVKEHLMRRQQAQP